MQLSDSQNVVLLLVLIVTLPFAHHLSQLLFPQCLLLLCPSSRLMLLHEILLLSILHVLKKHQFELFLSLFLLERPLFFLKQLPLKAEPVLLLLLVPELLLLSNLLLVKFLLIISHLDPLIGTQKRGTVN